MKDVNAMNYDRNIKFSIITVCLNAKTVIRPTIESVLQQDYGNFEYIIVDGVSTDGTLEIIREYAQRDLRIQWCSEPDNGVFNAMNKGIKRAAGEYLLFLNAGDEFHDSKVLSRAAKMAEGADILIGNLAFKTENGLDVRVYSAGRKLSENLRKGENVCHQVIFASRECVKDGFDERFTTCADYDWLCRQVNAGKKVIHLGIVVVDFDTHGITFQVKHQKVHWKEYFEVIGKNFPPTEFPYGQEVKKLFVQERKNRFMYEFMNRWLLLKQKGVDLSSFFVRQGIHSIAIYGIDHMGQRLYDELKGSSIRVAYAIDRNSRNLDWEIPVFCPDDPLEDVDAVVITPLFDFMDIKAALERKMDCRMLFIEEILFYEFETI